MLPKTLLTRRGSVRRAAVSVLLACLTAASTSFGGEGYFGYDESGRIIRSIDEQNRVTDYSYDEAGNIIGIRTATPTLAPTITSLTPDALRRGESKVIQVTGTQLLGVNISSADPGLMISNVGTMQSTDTQVSFTLTATVNAVLGTQQLTFTNSAGSTSAPITVNPALPTTYTLPGPLAVPPDGVQRQFALRLSNADNIDHSLNISVADSTVVAVGATTATIPAGAVEAQIPITGLQAGQTAVTFASATLGTSTFIVYVTSEYQEMNKARSALVGVVVEEGPQPAPSITYSPVSAPQVGILVSEPTAPPAPVTVSPVASPLVGLAVGGVVTSINPTSATTGQTVTLTVGGNALGTATAVQFSPDTGITTGAPSIAPDGASLSVEIVIAPDAPQTVRRVQVFEGSVALPLSDESISQFQIAP